MPSFDWITRDWTQLAGKNDYATVDLDEFLRLSGLDEDSDWLSLAQEWGGKQSPAINVGKNRDDRFTIALRKRVAQ